LEKRLKDTSSQSQLPQRDSEPDGVPLKWNPDGIRRSACYSIPRYFKLRW
jgi:hypothetical protein